MPARGVFLLTFDLEEFQWPAERGRRVDPETQVAVSCEGLARLLPVLDARRAPATFFTTASFARARPAIVRDLAARGHEIAAHGLSHGDDYRTMDAARLVASLRAARDILEALSGRPVLGFRAPRLRTGPPGAVREAGYLYGANVHPTWVPGRYRALGASRRPWREEGLIRVPISVIPWCHWPLSFVWYRALGARLGNLGARLAVAETGYLQVYFHPWEAVPLAPWGIPPWLAVRTGDAFVRLMEALLDWARDLEPLTVGRYVHRLMEQNPEEFAPPGHR